MLKLLSLRTQILAMLKVILRRSSFKADIHFAFAFTESSVAMNCFGPFPGTKPSCRQILLPWLSSAINVGNALTPNFSESQSFVAHVSGDSRYFFGKSI